MSKDKKNKGKISKKSKVNEKPFVEEMVAEKNENMEQKFVKRGRPPKHTSPMITMTIRISEDRKHALKLYAAKHMTTVSEVISLYIDELIERG